MTDYTKLIPQHFGYKEPEPMSTKKRPWNWGKRKPIENDGHKWCACLEPKLTHNSLPNSRGQALCLLCNTPWYH